MKVLSKISALLLVITLLLGSGVEYLFAAEAEDTEVTEAITEKQAEKETATAKETKKNSEEEKSETAEEKEETQQSIEDIYAQLLNEQAKAAEQSAEQVNSTALDASSAASGVGNYTITATALNVRYGPGTEYDSVGKVYSGSSYYVYEIQGSWGRIGEHEWISLDYATKGTTKLYKISTAGINFIKKYEGYSKYAYWDYSQWTIGYGCRCEENEYPNGITEPQAVELLKSVIGNYETYVDKYISSNNITVNQAQYDAMVSLTYNCGNLWSISGKGDLIKNILLNGANNYSIDEIVYAFTNTCITAGGSVLQGLINRRYGEAMLFISGWGSYYYEDVKNGSWYNECVGYCTRLQYMSGTGNNCFSPNDTLTREQLITILYRYSGVSGYNGYTRFYDVSSKAWYAPAVHWASSVGVTSGVGEDYFGVGMPVTREMLVTMLCNFASYIGADTSARCDYEKYYNDAYLISPWASVAVNWALAEGIIVGTANYTLSPGGYATRAAAAMIFSNFDKNVLGLYL